MVSRLLIGDNNLSRFWPAYQFSRATLKHATLLTATDFDTLDHALSQTEEKDQVIVSVLTSLLIDEVNQLEVESSAHNVCEQAVSRLVGLSCSFLTYVASLDMCNFSLSVFLLVQFFLAPPERCTLPRWYSTAYPKMYEALVKLVSRFPPNLHLLPIYTTDFTMFEAGESLSVSLCRFYSLILSRLGCCLVF